MTEPAAETVRSRADLAAFIRDLRDDLLRSPEEWENRSLESFLEAAAAWVDDMDGWFQNRGEAVPDRPDWSTLASILSAAKVYE